MKSSYKQNQPSLNSEPSINEYKTLGNGKISLIDQQWKRKKNSDIDSIVSITKASPQNRETVVKSSEPRDQVFHLTSPPKELVASNSDMKFDIISKIYENDKPLKSKIRPKIFL